MNQVYSDQQQMRRNLELLNQAKSLKLYLISYNVGRVLYARDSF